MRDIVQWSNEFNAESKPWLIVGKGPTFQNIRGMHIADYYVCSLNHVVREIPVTLAHIIDLQVVADCADQIYANARFLAMPHRPHIRNSPSDKTLSEFADEIPVLGALRKEGRLLWYNLSSSEPHASSPVIRAVYFSAEAALNILVACGAKFVRSVGVDGGRDYSDTFSDLKSSTLLANGHESFDRQFEGICETIRKSKIFYAPLHVDAPIRVFVGADASQALSRKLLEYSIKRFTPVSVDVAAIDDREFPIPRDSRNRSRSGFSFSRFDIPRLCGYAGRAIYMDADMQVFRDLTLLWNWPMAAVDVAYCRLLPEDGRPAQYSVMLLNCANLPWDVKTVIRGLDDGRYTYEELMHDLCILHESRKQMILPFEWNSLEHYDQGKTCLIHYTDMHTQPWFSNENANGHLWYALLNQAVEEGFVTIEDVHREIRDGHVSPELPSWAGLAAPGNLEALRRRWKPPYTRFVRDNQPRVGGLFGRFKRLLPYSS
jgi:hypothetical protein